MKKTFKRKKGPVQSKKISYDGINFASGLERYMYMALRKAKITSLYEGQPLSYQKLLNFLLNHTKDVAMAKVNTKTEVIKRY